NTFTLTTWQEDKCPTFVDSFQNPALVVGRSTRKMDRSAVASLGKNCRACAEHSSILVDLFSTEISDPPIWEMLNSILPDFCLVKRDEMPQKICPTCLVAAQNAVHFRHKCEQSFQFFSQLLQLDKSNSNPSRSRCRRGDRNPLIAFEVVGCEDPLATNASGMDTNRLDVKTDADKPTDAIATNGQGSEPLQEVFEITMSDIKTEEEISIQETFEDAFEDESENNNDSEEEDSDQWTAGSTEDHDEPWIPGNGDCKTVGGNNQSLLCTECGVSYSTQKALARHVAKHKEQGDTQKPHLCDFCGRGFRTNAQLTTHRRRHTGERPFKCPLCPKAYTHGPTLKSHMHTHDEEKAHKCPQCEKTFYTRGNLRAHIQRHTGERPYKCPDCPQTFAKNSGLKLHSRLHKEDRPYKCELCGKGFVQNQHLITHLRVHYGDRQFKCPDCDKSFFEKSNMMKHQRTHSGIKPFKCEECGQAFSHNHHLKSHLRIHTGEKPYKCDQCGKGFSANQSLMKHTLWHVDNNDRPFKCSQCPKAYDTQQSLRGHEKTHKTPDEPKTLHQCPHCDVRFALKKTLDKHITSHKIRPHPCPQCPEGFFSQKSLKKHLRFHNLKT
ncbi:zinc finger protein 660, partial [Drosophila teissieri]|uniref:zinc finger protein 660 n=1 Tax=Drosophila teissieri TaxID=7243 RepID=UPI001CB9FA2C